MQMNRGRAWHAVGWRGTAMVLATAMVVGCGGGGDDDAAVTPVPPVDAYPLVATPTVTGPIASEGFLSSTKNYTFYATDVALASRGYVEQEFFVEGKANIYNEPAVDYAATTLPTFSGDAAVVTEGLPYKTRMVVRRPTDPAKFNGTVIVEWFNVTDNFDGEYFWVQAKDHLLRDGYAYIGISAQSNGIAHPNLGLKRFSPVRYGSLDVTAGGTVAQDKLSYDIFSQAAKAARAVPAVLNGLPVKNVIAAGMSQSGWRMGPYANYVHTRAPIYDAFLVQVATPVFRDALKVPIISVLSESEATGGRLAASQPDTATRKTYWVAGSTHGDVLQRLGRTGVRLRDLGPQNTGNDACLGGSVPTRTRTPLGHVVSAAVHHLKQQVETGAVPPAGTPITLAADGQSIARDADGNALGGIRLAHMQAPTARADGVQCGNVGAWVPFDTARLNALYPSHADYVAQVSSAASASVNAGFVLAADAAGTVAEAQASVIGRGLECGLLCLSAGHFRADFSSTGLLREHTAYYNIQDGQRILQAIDEAHYWMASAYSSTGAAAIYHRNFTVSALQHYVELVRAAQIDGRVTGTAADLLTSQANTLVKAVQAL